MRRCCVRLCSMCAAGSRKGQQLTECKVLLSPKLARAVSSNCRQPVLGTIDADMKADFVSQAICMPVWLEDSMDQPLWFENCMNQTRDSHEPGQ